MLDNLFFPPSSVYFAPRRTDQLYSAPPFPSLELINPWMLSITKYLAGFKHPRSYHLKLDFYTIQIL